MVIGPARHEKNVQHRSSVQIALMPTRAKNDRGFRPIMLKGAFDTRYKCQVGKCSARAQIGAEE